MKTITMLLLLLLQLNLYAQAPKAPSQPVTETFFGMQVTDIYRNLENISDPAVLNWYQAIAAYTENKLKELPGRESVLKQLQETDSRFNYKVDIGQNKLVDRRKNKVYYIKVLNTEQTGRFYSKDMISGKEVLLFDPNKNNKSGNLNIINGYSVNYDGSKIALVIMTAGKEIGNMLIIDGQTGIPLDSIQTVWSPADWIDNETFYYHQHGTANVHSSSFFINTVSKKHKLGENAKNDPIVFSYKKNPQQITDSAHFPWVYSPHRNAKYVVGYVAGVMKFNDIYLAKAGNDGNKLNWYPFVKKEDLIMSVIIQGDKAFGLSLKDNPKGKILLTSAAKPDWRNAQVIAEPKNGSFGSSYVPFAVTKDYLYYVEGYGVEQNLYRVNLAGKPVAHKIKLPVSGTVVPLADSPVDPGLRIFLTSWTNPFALYDYDPQKDLVTKSRFRLAPDVEGFDNTEIEEVYAASHDGVKIPLSIIKPKGVKKDRNQIVLIEGYGNYGMTMSPFFDPVSSIMADHGIIRVVAHVRGGGEFGEEWRLGGYKSTKPNTWKDAIAAAEYMIAEGYTNPSKLAIMGTSAGGILVGRAMTERPDLFAVAIPRVGVLNMMRFEFTPNGPNHIPEFGTINNETDFKNIYAMDSYMHIKDGEKYPATLVTAGFNDPRVILWQPGKFAARLMEATASGKPVLFRVDMEGGHGVGSTKDQEFGELADIISFVLWQTGKNPSKQF